jgi:acyl-CoA synthetase (NDP forming)
MAAPGTRHSYPTRDKGRPLSRYGCTNHVILTGSGKPCPARELQLSLCATGASTESVPYGSTNVLCCETPFGTLALTTGSGLHVGSYAMQRLSEGEYVTERLAAGQPPFTDADVLALLDPRSIAVMGASADPAKAGGRPISYMRHLGFTGQIYPVNPNRSEVGGLRCYPSLGDIPEPVDLCVLAVPAEQVESSLKECAECGVKGAIVFASGFAEVGNDGRKRQDRIRKTALDNDIALVGPNCMGFVNFRTGAAPTFTTALERGKDMRPGQIAFVTQSGAVGAFVLGLAQDQSVGLSHFITTGNESVLGFAEYATALLQDPTTRVIAGYLEGLPGESLVRVAQSALAADKPLVIMKVGTSAAGAAASVAHTGKLVGSDQVYASVFRQFGIARAESLEELLDFSSALATERRPDGARVGIVSISGGAAILMADWCERLRLPMADFSGATLARLRRCLPWFGAVGNPVDTTGRPLWDEGMLEEAIAAVADDPGVDMVLCHVGLAPGSAQRLSAEIVRAASGTKKPLLVTWLRENESEPQQALRRAQVPVFVDPVRMTRAASVLVAYATAKRHQATREPELPSMPGLPAGTVVTEHTAKLWLADCGLRGPREEVVTSASEAVSAAQEIGFPVCAKLLSPDVPHRSELGGVRLNLRTADDVSHAFAEVVAASPVGAHVEGVLISEQVENGIELIVSGFRDSNFGPCILCGIGGIHAELFSDTAVRLAPVDPEGAREMLASLRGSALISGSRGGKPADIMAASSIISRVSALIAQCPPEITAIEINPLVVYPEGKESVVLDALITRGESPRGEFPRS